MSSIICIRSDPMRAQNTDISGFKSREQMNIKYNQMSWTNKRKQKLNTIKRK